MLKLRCSTAYAATAAAADAALAIYATAYYDDATGLLWDGWAKEYELSKEQNKKKPI